MNTPDQLQIRLTAEDVMMATRSLTFPEEWGLVRVHVHLRDQAEVGHVVALHGLEAAELCDLLNGFFAQITAQEI